MKKAIYVNLPGSEWITYMVVHVSYSTKFITTFIDLCASVRDKFVGYMESLEKSSFERIYMDFGAPESEQIPALIQRDIPFKEFCDELGFTVAFNIIIGGGGASKVSVDYLQKLVSVVDCKSDTVVCENITSFNQFPASSDVGVTIRLGIGNFHHNASLNFTCLHISKNVVNVLQASRRNSCFYLAIQRKIDRFRQMQ